jgi:hypothetical protein
MANILFGCFIGRFAKSRARFECRIRCREARVRSLFRLSSRRYSSLWRFGDLLPALPHPFVEIAGREDALGVFPIEPLIVGDISNVTKLHRRPRPLDPLGKVPDGRAVAEYGTDPFVLEPVWQLSKYGKDTPEPIGQGTINIVFDGPGIAQTRHVNVVTCLPNPLHSALPLQQP